MRVLDLYSGLGGFSEAFLLAGDEVMRVENNPILEGVSNTTIQDVLAVRDRLHLFHAQGQPIREYDVLLAGPPCRDFSLAYNAPQAKAQRSGEDYIPDMTHVEAILDIVRITKPRYWIIENVQGSQKHFAKLGLIPVQVHGAHVLYGHFPKFQPGQLPTKASKDKTSRDPLRMNHKALIPFALSSALRQAIVEQTTLFDFA